MAGRHREVSAAPARRSRRLSRRTWIILAIVVGVMLVAAIPTLITLRHLDRQYGPIEAGAFGGPYSFHDLVYSDHDRAVRLVDRPGATAQIIESLDNRGAHSVKVTSIASGGFVVAVKWSAYVLVPGGNVNGENTPWRDFPAFIPARGAIRLLVMIHRDDRLCGSSAPAADREYFPGNHTVHWDSLLHSHTTDVTRSSIEGGIRIC
jgi:hypothetical protein